MRGTQAASDTLVMSLLILIEKRLIELSWSHSSPPYTHISLVREEQLQFLFFLFSLSERVCSHPCASIVLFQSCETSYQGSVLLMTLQFSDWAWRSSFPCLLPRQHELVYVHLRWLNLGFLTLERLGEHSSLLRYPHCCTWICRCHSFGHYLPR